MPAGNETCARLSLAGPGEVIEVDRAAAAVQTANERARASGIENVSSYPRSDTFERCLEWICAAFAETGTNPRMGARLYSAFIAAGLPAPVMSLDAGISGGENNPACRLVAGVIRSLLPVLERFGIATEAEVGISSLEQRIQNEILAGGGVASRHRLSVRGHGFADTRRC